MKEIIKHKFPYLLFFLLLFSSFASAYGQERMITLNLSKVPLNTALKKIEKQTSMSVVYNTNDVDINRVISIKVSKESLTNVMGQLFKGTNISYSIVDKHIVLSTKKEVEQQKKTPIVATGTVTDAQGEPLIGVSILVKGTATGAITDMDGNFKIQAAKGDVLEISYIGYASQSITLANAQPLKVTMGEDTQTLDEVVVTALGIKREQKALSYNVQQVKGDELTTIKDANFMNALAGKVAGVNINSSSAGAGGAVRVIMRGTKSLEKDDNALYVIDGVPMFNVTSGSADGGTMSDQPGTNSVADINPEDIESMSILTGPSAAALYGSAAANGVVLITTKKGVAGKVKITYSNSTTFSSAFKMPEFQNTYGNVLGENTSWGSKLESPTNFDPVDFFNTGVNEINGFTFTTGNEHNQTYASVSTTNSTGLLPNNSYNRYNFSLRNTSKFMNDKLTLDLGAQYVIQNNKNMVGSGQYFNPLVALYLFPRGENFQEVRMYERYDEARNIMTQYWPTGIFGSELDMQNPYWIMNRMNTTSAKRRYIFNASLKWDIAKWINVVGRIKVDNSDMDNYKKFNASTNTTFTEGSNKGFYGHTKQNDRSFYGDVLVNISKNFLEDKLSLNANIGAAINDMRDDNMYYKGGLATIPNFFHFGNVNPNISKRNEFAWHDQTQSIFGSVELGWNHMLYLTATGRNDWASQLAFTSQQSYFYPSVGLSVVLSEMFKLPEVISYLKIRGSWAEVASAPERYLTLMQYKYNEQTNIYEYPDTHYDTNLKPENTKSWELGLNAKFWANRINFDMTFYRSNTFNQTFYVDASASSGYKKNIVQTGNIRNQGIELAVGYSDTFNKVKFSTNFTYTLNQNKIISLANGAKNPENGETIDMEYYSKGTLGANGGPTLRMYEGGTMGDIYTNQRLRQSPNGYIWVDPKNGTVELENTEYQKLGSILPKYYLGWNGNVGWKGLNFGFAFSARVGGLCVSDTQAYLDRYGVSKVTATARDGGDIKINAGTVPSRNYYETISSAIGTYYTYSATNVRLSELSLSYTLPKKWFNDACDLTLGVTGKNLWMIYCKAPFDPESTSSTSNNFYQGVDYFQQPSTRSFGFNVKLSF
ncbi:SusC/RagA family TonB-linked outer membrane protein [Bacteroides thetaiotaomicron]|nr:SusC/RagA family TonB-linked outer membrane protein [Bacteroides thetaiotaomicron]MCS3213323.1 SusC/RagA family TonB-linked outer membrane protein [Bacteroides thetaiotaomicron]